MSMENWELILTRLEAIEKKVDKIVEIEYKVKDIEKKGLDCIVWKEQDTVRRMIEDYKENKEFKKDLKNNTINKLLWIIISGLLFIFGLGAGVIFPNLSKIIKP